MSSLKFNLKKSNLEKKAFYDGASQPVREMSRYFMNCQKAKLDSGIGAQEAWQSCLEEYQKNKSGGDWSTKYANSNKNNKNKKK